MQAALELQSGDCPQEAPRTCQGYLLKRAEADGRNLHLHMHSIFTHMLELMQYMYTAKVAFQVGRCCYTLRVQLQTFASKLQTFASKLQLADVRISCAHHMHMIALYYLQRGH